MPDVKSPCLLGQRMESKNLIQKRMNHGISILSEHALANEAHDEFLRLLHNSPWASWLAVHTESSAAGHQTHYQLSGEGRSLLTPEDSTLSIMDTHAAGRSDTDQALADEILLGLLSSPYPQIFPSHEELLSHIRVRKFIAQAAKLTSLRFDTRAVDRPMSHWLYDEALGFTLKPSRSLIEALRLATQPAFSGREFAFSCYRASEYVILLGIAQEAQISNPVLYENLQLQWQVKAIASGAFHETFLIEHGTLAEPIPMLHYIPGDRVWFRNPDLRSSNVSGYEGSWVIYMGAGLFSNFWDCSRPFSLNEKCVEVFHWRDGAYVDDAGVWCMDEAVVAQQVALSLSDPHLLPSILLDMKKYREPSGVYQNGGCIDATRESPRLLRPQTCDIVLRDI
jgi:hypothetical protein